MSWRPASIVTAKVAGGETMRFLLGSREVAGDGIEVYSEQSPLGAAIIGKHRGRHGDLRRCRTARQVEVEVVDTEPFAG